jgi:hypothetical protein
MLKSAAAPANATAPPPQIIVVENWFEELKSRARE